MTFTSVSVLGHILQFVDELVYRGAFPFSFYMEDVLSHLTRVF